jgi:hypothetical protein
MWSAIQAGLTVLLWVLDKFSVSKERQNQIKRDINIQVRKILKNKSNSSEIREQYHEAEKRADEYLKGGK